MNELLQNLLKLQALDFTETKPKALDAAKLELRARIPTQVLAHYDRLVTRGKKGIALVRNQVCAGCHMRLPMGVIVTLKQGTDIQLCDNCGRYLFLVETETPAVLPPAKTAPRGRRRAMASAA
jgi:predicted  nucleic acid-binding Zn-ribbon protein